MEHEDNCIDNWYVLGRKLYEGEPRFVCTFDEKDLPQYVQVFFKSDGNGRPSFFRFATLSAFQHLRDRGILEIRDFGRDSWKMSGWILTKQGRNRIGRYDEKGSPIPTNPGRTFTLEGPLGRRLPVAGLLRNNK